ncbi:MAG: hypothetical protein U5N27_22650 [Rhizobium sp.]|nr:hypothetical protein [Rhizobium sp.]
MKTMKKTGSLTLEWHCKSISIRDTSVKARFPLVNSSTSRRKSNHGNCKKSGSRCKKAAPAKKARTREEGRSGQEAAARQEGRSGQESAAAQEGRSGQESAACQEGAPPRSAPPTPPS